MTVVFHNPNTVKEMQHRILWLLSQIFAREMNAIKGGGSYENSGLL
ncbi:MAG: hypothetical protein ACYCX2_06300 [Christensenellales bacterium]